jgi:hypothetical protein
MRRPGDPERAEHAYLAPAQPEPAEDFVLASCEQGTNPAQARSHPEGPHLEIRARRSPATKYPIRYVLCHAGIVPQENY